MTSRIPMTKPGAAMLKKELERLTKEERPKIIQAISEARALGDLKENAEYHAAKELQGMTEARIQHLESQLQMAQIIDITQIKNEGKVVFGSTITLKQTESNQQMILQIVGEHEADVNQGRLAVNSPVARACIGKFENDIVEVETPKGGVEYEILNVEYV